MLAPECSFAWDGAALSILLGAIPIAVVLTLTTMFLYRWAVERAMRAAAQQAAPAPEPAQAASSERRLQIVVASEPESAASVRPSQWRRSMQASRRLSMAYVLAGAVHASLSTAIMFWLNEIEFAPFRALAVWTVFAWPIVAVLTMTGSAVRRWKVLIIAAYFAFLLALEIIAEAFGLRHEPHPGELFLLWAIIMGPATFVILLLSNRAWRTVGLTALFVAIVLVGAFILGFQLLGCAALTTRSGFLLSGWPYLLLVAVLACGALTWSFLRRAANRYRRKLLSDQMLTVNSWWLLVTALEILFEMSSSGGGSFTFLLSYVGYRITLRFALRTSAADRGSAKPQSILLLRVFGHGQRTRTLADQVGQSWRHTGPINMIGGVDLATALLEPDELMAFWSGKLREGFIAGPDDLRARMENLDERPDPDGRYRINEFFCHDNTWRATVHALAQRSAVVLMDLRGFGKENRGCEFELTMLLSEMALSRIVLLVDRSTRVEDLKAVLRSAWEKSPASSPNRTLQEPVLRLHPVEHAGKALPPLLTRLYSAAAA